MRIKLSSRADLTMDIMEGGKDFTHVSTDVNLLSKRVGEEGYEWGEENLATTRGSQLMTATLIQALIANIVISGKRGILSEESHLDYIVKELKKGLSSHSTVKRSNYNKDER